MEIYILVREITKHLKDTAAHVAYELSIIDHAQLISALIPKIESDAAKEGFELDSMSRDNSKVRHRAYYVMGDYDITYTIYNLSDLKRNQTIIGQFFGREAED